MKERCYRKKCNCYNEYGARGITVCDEWKHNFLAFKEWALANGYTDNLTIDRIDVNGNYEPKNCRWVTMYEQCQNKRNTHYIEWNGQRRSVANWCKILGVVPSTFYRRIARGVPIDEIFSAPKGIRVKKRK